MTITESKRRFDDNGNVHYQKHKIFLYREDFANFEEGFVDAVEKIQELMATGNYRDPIAEREAKAETEENSADETTQRDTLADTPEEETTESSSDDITFEDL